METLDSSAEMWRYEDLVEDRGMVSIPNCIAEQDSTGFLVSLAVELENADIWLCCSKSAQGNTTEFPGSTRGKWVQWRGKDMAVDQVADLSGEVE